YQPQHSCRLRKILRVRYEVTERRTIADQVRPARFRTKTVASFETPFVPERPVARFRQMDLFDALLSRRSRFPPPLRRVRQRRSIALAREECGLQRSGR